MSQAHHLEFQIDQLKKDKMILALESIGMFLFSFFLTVYLPQLLFQFLFANQQLTEEPPVMKYIPVASFVIAVGYFFYATAMVMMKAMKVKQLSKELSMMPMDDCCGGECGCDHDHHDEHHSSWLNEEEEETVSKPAKSVKKATKKKSAASKK